MTTSALRDTKCYISFISIFNEQHLKYNKRLTVKLQKHDKKWPTQLIKNTKIKLPVRVNESIPWHQKQSRVVLWQGHCCHYQTSQHTVSHCWPTSTNIPTHHSVLHASSYPTHCIYWLLTCTREEYIFIHIFFLNISFNLFANWRQFCLHVRGTFHNVSLKGAL